MLIPIFQVINLLIYQRKQQQFQVKISKILLFLDTQKNIYDYVDGLCKACKTWAINHQLKLNRFAMPFSHLNSNFWYSFSVQCTHTLFIIEVYIFYLHTLAFTFAHNHNSKILSSFKCDNSITVEMLCRDDAYFYHFNKKELKFAFTWNYFVHCALDKIYLIFEEEKWNIQLKFYEIVNQPTVVRGFEWNQKCYHVTIKKIRLGHVIQFDFSKILVICFDNRHNEQFIS